MKETRPLWPPQRGVGLREPNLGKTNPRVSLHYSLAICFAPSLADSIIFLTLTRLVVVFKIINFRFALFTPSRRLSVTQETHDFYPVVRPSNTCLLPRCGVPTDESCTQLLSSDPMINLNTTTFLPYLFFLFVRNLHKSESLALTTKITMKTQE